MAAEALIVEDAYQRGYADAIADMRKKKEQRRQREQAKKACRWYFIKQKAYGLAMLAVTVLAAWATEGDITIKEKLYRLGGNYACVEYGEYEDVKKKRGGAEADKKRHVICISDGCLEEIGEYATKERCLEVLDEIQKACVSYLFTAGGAAIVRGGMDVQPFAAVIPRLYEMPEK